MCCTTWLRSTTDNWFSLLRSWRQKTVFCQPRNLQPNSHESDTDSTIVKFIQAVTNSLFAMSRQSYLVFYNGVSTVVWAYIFVNCLCHVSRDLAVGSIDPTFTGFPHKVLVYSQLTNSALEVTHIIMGLVKAPLGTTILQSMARLIITLGICRALPESPGNFDPYAFNGLTLAWSLTEIIRYGFYMVKLVATPPYWLLWLRYSLFIVLYPVGLVSELCVVYQSLPFTQGTGHRWLLIFTLLSYIPGFLLLYTYMFKQRGKMLGKEDKSAKFLKKNPKFQ